MSLYQRPGTVAVPKVVVAIAGAMIALLTIAVIRQAQRAERLAQLANEAIGIAEDCSAGWKRDLEQQRPTLREQGYAL